MSPYPEKTLAPIGSVMGYPVSELRAQIETGCDFDVLWITTIMTGRTCNISARYAGSAIAVAELRIAAATLGPLQAENRAERPATRQCTWSRGRDPTSWAGTSLDPRADEDADCGTGARLPEFLRM